MTINDVFLVQNNSFSFAFYFMWYELKKHPIQCRSVD